MDQIAHEIAFDRAVSARRSLDLAALSVEFGVNLRPLGKWDGHYVTPIQKVSNNLKGPVLVLKDWLEWEKLEETELKKAHSESELKFLRDYGYLENKKMNRILDKALQKARLQRSDIYITQALPVLRSVSDTRLTRLVEKIAPQVLKFELVGRQPIAMGPLADAACRAAGVAPVSTFHPSAMPKNWIQKLGAGDEDTISSHIADLIEKQQK